MAENNDFSTACVLWDIENFAPMMGAKLTEAFVEVKKMAEALHQFMVQNKFLVDTRNSVVCVKRSTKMENPLREIMAPYGIQLIKAERNESAENVLLRQVEKLAQQGKPNLPSAVIILSGDSDLLPALHKLKNNGVQVAVIGWLRQTHRKMKQAGTVFIPFESVLRQTHIQCRKITEYDV